MLGWTLRRAKASLLRDLFLTRIQIVGLALGIAVWITAHVAIDTQTRTPSGLAPALYRVDAHRPGPDPPELHSYLKVIQRVRNTLTWEEARDLTAVAGPDLHARTFAAELALAPGGRPTHVRFADRDLFALFGETWLSGGPWTRDEEIAQAPVAVIDAELAEAWFGTTDAVGRSFRVGARDVRVTGVIALRRDVLRLYDVSNFALPEEIFLPVALWPLLDGAPFMMHPLGDQTGSATSLEAGAFVHLWLSLPDGARRAGFAHRLPDALRLQPVDEWKAQISHIPPGFREFELIATLALIASALNLVRLYMAKFHSRAREVCIHRAMGATRAQVFLVHLAETELVALAGTVCGLFLGQLGLALLNLTLPDRFVVYSLDLASVAAATAVGLLAGGLAGLYPAWRVGSLPPATFLRRE